MSIIVARNLSIKEMQNYYDRTHGGRNAYINRGALETWNPQIRNGEIKLPPEFACVSDGKVLTWDEVKQRRRERQKAILEQKRSSYGQIQKKPLYVWVFWCCGISGIFEGWWTYFVGTQRDYRGGGYKGEVAGDLFNQIKELFPVENPHPLYAIEDNEWMQLFAKQYQRGGRKRGGKPQGKSLIWAEVQGDRVERILSRAEWPSRPAYPSQSKGQARWLC